MAASSNAETLAIIACAAAALALLAAGAALFALSRVRSAQRILIGDEQRDLVSHAADLQQEFEALHSYVGAVAERLDERLGEGERGLEVAISHRGLIRYDAYHEMSGRQSFSLALLDPTHSGIVVSSIHHREQARIYTKYVTAGKGDIPLTPEEEEAIRLAMDGAPPPLPEVGRMTGTLGFLGPAGTYSEEAARRADPDAQTVPFATEREAIMAVVDGRVERAIVPIENSLEGAVTGTLDTLAGEELPVTIVGEVILSITLCLIGTEGEAIETVLSHPQPLAQSRRFLAAELPHADQVAAKSTADAVRTVAEGPAGLAAIGARAAAGLYGLDVLREGVEDDPGNQTRFVVIAGDGIQIPAGPGSWKTTLVFHGAEDDSPGWLVRCLSELSNRSINLTKIESRPNRRQLGHYIFVLDLEGSQDDPDVRQAIAGLRTHCEEVRVLGSYLAA